MLKQKRSREGYTLVETLVGVAVMALVITGGLVSLGQASLLTEKNTKQVIADFVLRNEVESLRAADWSELANLHATVSGYLDSNSSEFGYPHFMSLNKDELFEMGFRGEVTSAQLHSSGETGKMVFRVLVNWSDRSGRSHEEARVLVITEGGISAES
jgi:hypothetical protein